ncbi:MAG: glycosidase, partial [Spirochaetaceae bacterium]
MNHPHQTGETPFEVHSTDLGPDYSLIIPRTFGLSADRIDRIVSHISRMTDREVDRLHAHTNELFAHRHYDVDALFRARADLVEQIRPGATRWDDTRRELLGSCFIMEYSIAAAALFNPSICLTATAGKAVLSLRAVGEGHISSVLFRSARVADDATLTVSPAATKLSTGTVSGDMASGDYEVRFDSSVPLEGRVLFPQSPNERAGLEDVRLVTFYHDPEPDLGNAGGASPQRLPAIYGTVTGYDGETAVPKMFVTEDFQTFNVFSLHGTAARNKDMGLFPCKVGGRYAMVGRQDGHRMTFMHSDSIDRWDSAEPLREPRLDWEIMQIGGCGSPIEVEEGWLLPMHGVGPFRRYSIGFYLLDRNDPSRVIAATPKPVLEPQDDERDGYVPNVVYTCGATIYNDTI